MTQNKEKKGSRRLATERPGMFVKNGKLLLARNNSLAPASQVTQSKVANF
jgi:hypothetical protein